ncbi:MAG TPA: hypothetical protein PLY78_03510, partial [Methanospirillum sp.]|nr:hypothetical protein [Methanospirillum sp.]
MNIPYLNIGSTPPSVDMDVVPTRKYLRIFPWYGLILQYHPNRQDHQNNQKIKVELLEHHIS